MALSQFLREEDLSCPVCLEVFTEPVLLSCGHGLCRVCVERSWARAPARECPVCRQRAPAQPPPSDLVLKRICESYVQQRSEKDSSSRGLQCPLHLERLHLFCVEDEKLVCVQCVSQDHQNHSFCSLSKAASRHKDILLSDLSALKEKLQRVKKNEDITVQEAAHIRSQAQQTEKQIKEEFEKLHQFLRKEEKARITALKEEEKEKSQRMKKKTEELDKQMKDINSRIRELEDTFKDDALFLQDFRRTHERAQYRGLDPALDPGALIDVAKHLGNLRYRVWGKMKDVCPYSPLDQRLFPENSSPRRGVPILLSCDLPISVVLDPNTANAALRISPDLSSFSRSAENTADPQTAQQLPDNPERMSAYTGVLGSEGFSSGTHSWEVDVGEGVDWVIGVAEESVKRKENCIAVPEEGFCCLWRENGNIVAANSGDSHEKIMPQTTRRFRVTLNWESGQVTFSNADSDTALYTFTRTFTKKMFPYFYNGSQNVMKVLACRGSVRPGV